MNDPNLIELRHTQLIYEPSVPFNFDLVEQAESEQVDKSNTAEALLRLIEWLDTGIRLRTTGVKVAAVHAYLSNMSMSKSGKDHGVSRALLDKWAVQFRKRFGILHASNTRSMATCEASRRAALRRHAERKEKALSLK